MSKAKKQFMHDYGKAVGLANRRHAEFGRLVGLSPVITDKAEGIQELVVPDSEASERYDDWAKLWELTFTESVQLETLFHQLATTRVQPEPGLVKQLEALKHQCLQCSVLALAETDNIEAARKGISLEQLFDDRAKAAAEDEQNADPA